MSRQAELIPCTPQGCTRGCFPGGLQQTSRVNIHKITVPRRRYVALSASSSLFSKDMFLLALRATFKLAVGCSGIMLLMKAGRIPSTAPQVLSQLGFNVTIPAMLFIKSAETLAAAQDARYLLVPLITALEIALGMALGWVAAEWAVCPAPSKPSQAQAAIAASVASTVGAPSLAPSLYPEPASAPAGMRAVVQTASTFGNSLTIPLLFMLSLYPASLSSLASGSVALVLLGWSPLFWTFGHSRMNGAANAILAQSAAGDKPSNQEPLTSYGIQLQHPPAGSPAAPTVVTTSTLPTEMGALPGVAELRRMEASGKLFLPDGLSTNSLWNTPVQSSSSSSSFLGQDPDESDDNSRTVDYSDFSSSESDSESILPPPKPLSSADQPEIVSPGDIYKPVRLNSGTDVSRGANRLPNRRMIPIRDTSIPPRIQIPLLGGEREKRRGGLLLPGGPEKPPEWQWVTSVRRILNPPLVATAGGLVLGLSPFGPLLLTPSNPEVIAFVAQLPWELATVLSALRCVAEIAALLGSLTLGLQLLVLGASLIPKSSTAASGQAVSATARDASSSAQDSESSRYWWEVVWDVLRPADRWETRQLIATSTVRLLVLPACTLAMIHGLGCIGMLPPSRMCVGALLVASCMPSAQNLVLLLNLRPETACLAPAMARLLLRQVLLAAVPVTVWISIFMTYLQFPVGA